MLKLSLSNPLLFKNYPPKKNSQMFSSIFNFFFQPIWMLSLKVKLSNNFSRKYYTIIIQTESKKTENILQRIDKFWFRNKNLCKSHHLFRSQNCGQDKLLFSNGLLQSISLPNTLRTIQKEVLNCFWSGITYSADVVHCRGVIMCKSSRKFLLKSRLD